MINLDLGCVESDDNLVRIKPVPYGPRSGLPQLREAIGEWVGVESKYVTVTTGATAALLAILSLVRTSHASVLCPRPYYPGYTQLLSLLGIRPIFYEVGPRATTELVEGALRLAEGTTAAILWNFPHNPTGAVDDESVYRKLLTVAEKHGMYVISDRVYWDIAHSEVSWSWLGARISPCEIRVGSFSKAFGLAGERVGFAIADSPLIDSIALSHWRCSLSAPVSGQMLAYNQLIGSPKRDLKDLRNRLAVNLERLQILQLLPYVHCKSTEGAFYAWIEVPNLVLTSTQLMTILKASGVTISDGAHFGAKLPCVRMSLGSSVEQFAQGVNIVFNTLKELGDNGLVAN